MGGRVQPSQFIWFELAITNSFHSRIDFMHTTIREERKRLSLNYPSGPRDNFHDSLPETIQNENGIRKEIDNRTSSAQ